MLVLCTQVMETTTAFTATGMATEAIGERTEATSSAQGAIAENARAHGVASLPKERGVPEHGAQSPLGIAESTKTVPQ